MSSMERFFFEQYFIGYVVSSLVVPEMKARRASCSDTYSELWASLVGTMTADTPACAMRPRSADNFLAAMRAIAGA